MDVAAGLALTFLAVVVAVNLANGTLTDWLKAKFLGQTPAKATATAAASGSATAAPTATSSSAGTAVATGALTGAVS